MIVRSTVTSLIDVQVDFVVRGLGSEMPPRLTLHEIADVFTHAWHLAFDVLPQALDAPRPGVDLGNRPRVDMYIINERPEHTGDSRTFRLGDLVDLDVLGKTNKTHLHRLDMSVLGRGALPHDEARDVVRQALVRSAVVIRWMLTRRERRRDRLMTGIGPVSAIASDSARNRRAACSQPRTGREQAARGPCGSARFAELRQPGLDLGQLGS